MDEAKDRITTLGFTDDQRNAYNELISFIDSAYNENDFKRALVGPAGTGKTYLVKAIIKNCHLSYSTIGLAAPTHKAARVLSESIGLINVKINTLQSDLGLKLNYDNDNFDVNNPPFDPRGRIKIGQYQLYIVDEASMINRSLTTLLEKTCKTNKCKLIYIGDSHQLPPVNELYSPALRGVKISSLKQIVRQEETNPVGYLLNLLRYDIEHRTFKFLEHISRFKENFNEGNTQGYKVCSSREFTELVTINFNDEELTRNVDYCKIIAYTNAVVSSWNKLVRGVIIKDAEKSIITKNDLILSYITIVNQFNEGIIFNSEDYILQDVVNYTHPQYELKGFLCRFIAIHGGKTTTPLFVVDHTDKFTMAKYMKLSEQFINNAKSAGSKTRAQRWREYYAFKESCLLLANIITSNGTMLYPRNLDYGFALTSHKSQGSTFDTVFVDVNDIVYTKNGTPHGNAEQINRLLYVACSRCKNKLYLRYGR